MPTSGWRLRISSAHMYRFKREMGCSTEELLRWLPPALGDLYLATSVILDGKVMLQSMPNLLEICGHTKPSRQIALLTIPVLDVSLSFAKSLSNHEVEQVLRRFDLYTRRGGG